MCNYEGCDRGAHYFAWFAGNYGMFYAHLCEEHAIEWFICAEGTPYAMQQLRVWEHDPEFQPSPAAQALMELLDARHEIVFTYIPEGNGLLGRLWPNGEYVFRAGDRLCRNGLACNPPSECWAEGEEEYWRQLGYELLTKPREENEA